LRIKCESLNNKENKYYDFHVIKSITRIDAVIVNESPLRVGVGREAPLGSAADNTVIKLTRGRERIPYIPGSSLKGVFRTYLEQLVRSLGEDVHDPWSVPEGEEDNPCVICGIFGNTSLASHVRVFDALPRVNPRLFIKTGVSIDREFGAARPGLLYTEEFVPPQVEWNFRMEIVNIDFPPHSGQSEQSDKRVELLASLFRMLSQEGVQVGARRSVGAGVIRLKQVHWRKYTLREGQLTPLSEGNEI